MTKSRGQFAGVEKHYIKPVDLDTVIAEYLANADMSLYDVQRKYGYRYATFRRILLRRGIPIKKVIKTIPRFKPGHVAWNKGKKYSTGPRTKKEPSMVTPRTSSSAIITFANRFVDPLHFRPEDADIETIAHALSNVGRFNGHLREFYSVAQHSVHVAERVILLRDQSPRTIITGGAKLALRALLHDASEAYIADVSRPVKHAKGMEQYRVIEGTIQGAIYECFGVGSVDLIEHDNILSHADNELLALEAQQLGGWDITLWNIPMPRWQRMLCPQPPKVAEEMFLQMFEELT